MPKRLLVILCLAALVSAAVLAPATAVSAAPGNKVGVPKVTILAVVPDMSVQVQISGFSSETIRVMLGAAKDSKINWIVPLPGR
jgi:hypothetical protein